MIEPKENVRRATCDECWELPCTCVPVTYRLPPVRWSVPDDDASPPMSPEERKRSLMLLELRTLKAMDAIPRDRYEQRMREIKESC